jgi:methylase of polypeptide subunit release factors
LLPAARLVGLRWKKTTRHRTLFGLDAPVCDYLDWLTEFGIEFRAGEAVRDPDHDAPLIVGDAPTRTFAFDGIPDIIEHRDPAAGLGADHASESLARALLPLIEPGAAVWDIGCGTGLLSVVPALAGARPVLGTELDPAMLVLARRTVQEAGVDVELLQGSLLEPIPADAHANIVVANLPHKPVPPSVGLKQAGGADGAAVHVGFIEQAECGLTPGARIVFFLHSLPHRRLLKRYADAFDLELLRWKRRYFQPGEYGDLQEQFVQRAEDGLSYVVEREGRRFVLACVWLAVKR